MGRCPHNRLIADNIIHDTTGTRCTHHKKEVEWRGHTDISTNPFRPEPLALSGYHRLGLEGS